MLSKEYRISKKKEIESLIFSRNPLTNGKVLRLKKLNNSENSQFRLLIAISKKYSKLAVKRNLLKRRIWFVIAQKYSLNKVPLQYDYQIILQKSAKNLTFEDILTDLNVFFK